MIPIIRLKNVKQIKVILPLSLFFLFCYCNFATAAPIDGSGSFVGLIQLIQQQSGSWYEKLYGYGLRLFWLLAGIQLVFTFIPLLFRQADISEIVGELVKFILIIGFFLAVLQYSQEWSRAIVDSFREAAAGASGRAKALTPGDVFIEALEMAKAVGGSASMWDPAFAVLIGLATIIILLCFTFMSAYMALTLIESFIVINASVLLMGFSGSQWTRDIALTTMKYAVSVGVKLFILTLLITMVVDTSQTWRAAYDQSSSSLFTLIGLSLVCAYLTKTIPEIIAGLLSGSSGGAGTAIGAMAGAAAGAAAAAATVATAGAAAPAAASATGLGGAGASAGAGALTAGASGSGGISASQMTGAGSKGLDAISQSSNSSNNSPKIGGGSNQNKSNSNALNEESGSNSNSKIQDIASAAIKTTGVLSSLSVPGMEGSENLSLGSSSPSPAYSQVEMDMKPNSASSNLTNEAENTISASPLTKDEKQ